MINIDKLHKPFVLLSAATKNCTETGNDIAHNLLKSELVNERFSFKEVIGVYKGVEEKSFYVETNDIEEAASVILKGISFKQESVLWVNSDRRASLCIFEDDTQIKLGTFKQVSKQEATKQDNYTYDFANNAYYICE